ncbi:TolC family protein [Oleiharenicola lentus]|uniref:TolC family protein n=1 Tax=Oleiharenicola lentus TaxID=2508720 RepID=UPI003F663809
MTTTLCRLSSVLLATALLTSHALAQNEAPKEVVPTTVPGSTATPEASTPELTLEQCIQRALARNFDLEIGRFNPLIAKDAIDVARGGYEPVLTSSGVHGKTTSRVAGTSSTVSDLRIGVSQDLYTGTTVSASSSLDRSKLNPLLLQNPNPAYDADVTLSVRQSLLRGFGTAVNRANLNRAKIGLDRANLDYKATALDIIQATEFAYFDLTFAREQLKVRQFSLELANTLFDEAKSRESVGTAIQLDVLQSEVGVANARRNLILAEQSVKDRQDALLALIGQFELDAPVGTVRFAETPTTLPVFASSLNLAKQNQPDYLSSIAAIEQLKLDLRIAKDNVKPDLTVGGAVGLGSSDTNTGRGAIGNALDRDRHSWQVDFAFSYPLGNVSNRARYRQSLSTLSREEIRLRLIEQNIEVQVRAAVRSVETNLESVRIAALASQLSQRQYEAEKSRFEAGRSTSRIVLEAQDDLEINRVSELQAQAALHSAIAALHRIEGSSLQRYSITLP